MIALILLFVVGTVNAQEMDQETSLTIVSVNDIKNLISESFENMEDYTANIEWINGTVYYAGQISYKKANMILIEFEEPEDQVIVSNGTYLLYLHSLSKSGCAAITW
jgi:outer membrane lipoprotein-sorting protein